MKICYTNQKIEYGPYRVGDVVFVKQYKYTNWNKGYDHFLVIISENNLAVPIEFFGMLVSSKLEKLKYNTNILLKKDEENGLDKDSIVKTDVIYRINNEQILFKIGKVDLANIEEYKRMYLNNI